MTHEHEDKPETRGLCLNCNDGCEATRFCDGCNQLLCNDCYEEHNSDAECHCP